MITICPNDEELLAVASGDEPSADLQSHLQECSRCARKVNGLKGEVKELKNAFGSILPASHTPPPKSATPASRIPPGDSAVATTAVPTMIGKYHVVGTLGSGGQASVYLAVHPILNEQVVLKLASRAPEDEDASKTNRLVAEGRVLCQLKHPNIGRVFDLDFFERRPFIIMEFVRGRALDQYARDRIALKTLEIASIGAKIARALESAHRLGIVHQDIKPQNIIIDESDSPKLIDFGMARLNGAWAGDERQPLGGTIQYMAPEQARAEAKGITGQSDVFALGAVLYFLITGKPPFGGGSRDQNLKRAKECDFDVNTINNSTVSPALKKIVLTALASNPAQRFAGAKEMADALESIQRAATLRRRLLRASPFLVVTVAIIFAIMFWPRKAPLPPAGQMLITPDGMSTIEGNLPLMTGQKIKIDGDVPRDMPTVVFWIGAGGQVFRMPTYRVRTSNAFDHVYSPGEGKTTEVTGKAGTEFLLMISGRGLDEQANIDALETQLKSFFATHALAELPPTGVVLLDPSGAHSRFLNGKNRSRDPGAETADACAPVSTPLGSLSKNLSESGYYFAGIAVAHQDAN